MLKTVRIKRSKKDDRLIWTTPRLHLFFIPSLFIYRNHPAPSLPMTSGGNKQLFGLAS
jgi:hypothetical protein